MYKVDSIKSDTLVSSIKDILIRLNIPLSDAHSQCHNAKSIYRIRIPKNVFYRSFNAYM